MLNPTGRILHHCTPEQYHRDPCERPSLSSSIAKLLVTASPHHAWSAHPRFGARSHESTSAMSEGSILHKLILGKGVDIVTVDAPDFRTNHAKAIRDQALADGKIPIIESKFATYFQTAAIIKDRLQSFGYDFKDGAAEVVVEWEEQGLEGPVLCRAMLDYLMISQGKILDLKKTENAHPISIAKNIVTLGYDIQYTAYTRAIESLDPNFRGRIDFDFLYCEMEPPYAVVPATLDGGFREIGALRWRRAVELWERCLKTNHWPSYTDKRVVLEPPGWVLTQELGSEQ